MTEVLTGSVIISRENVPALFILLLQTNGIISSNVNCSWSFAIVLLPASRTNPAFIQVPV